MMGSKNPESCVTFYDDSKLVGITSLPNKNADGTSEFADGPNNGVKGVQKNFQWHTIEM